MYAALLSMCLWAATQAATLVPVARSAGDLDAGIGAGGVVLRTDAAVFVLAGGVLTRRDDIGAVLPPGTTRLDGDDAALVAYDGAGARALVTLRPVGSGVLPAAMLDAERVLLDAGTPTLAKVWRESGYTAVGPRGPFTLPAGAAPPGLVPALAEACATMSARDIGSDAEGLWVSATTCRADAPAALLRWPRTGDGAPRRVVLPANLDVGRVVTGPKELYVATRAQGGTTAPAGALVVRGAAVTALPNIASALEAPDLVYAVDGLWALATVLVTPDRFGPLLVHLEAGKWVPVPLPEVDGSPLEARRLLVDASGQVWVVARGEGWCLLGTHAPPTVHELDG